MQEVMGQPGQRL